MRGGFVILTIMWKMVLITITINCSYLLQYWQLITDFSYPITTKKMIVARRQIREIAQPMYETICNASSSVTLTPVSLFCGRIKF